MVVQVNNRMMQNRSAPVVTAVGQNMANQSHPNRKTETIVLNGVQYILWYETPEQRQMALNEHQRMYGFMSEKKKYEFGFMGDGLGTNGFGML